MDLKNEQILMDFGLTENEAKVYMGLLKLGSVTAGEITKKSGIHRATVYDILERLTEKGLVSYSIKANRKYFEAVDPNQLLSLLEDKKEKIQSILPELLMQRKLSKEPQEATIFKGKKGMKSVYEDVLKEAKEILVYGAEGKFKDIMQHYFTIWQKRRVKARIPAKIIYSETIRGKRLKEEIKYVKIKYIPKEYATPANTLIYSNKIVIMVWGQEPIATMIRSKEIVTAYTSFFNLLWKIAKK